MANHTEKKRKRVEDGSSKARKKVNIQVPSQPSSVRVSSVKSVKNCPPVIATTPGLCISPSVSFQAYSKLEAPTSKRSKKSAAPASLLLHSSAHRTLDYTAKEDGPDGRESHLRHYIGVFDPKTGQLSVMEARKMAVRGTVRARNASEEGIPDRTVSKTMMERRNDLGQAFGTKKAKKAIAALTENRIAPQQATTDAYGSTKLSATSQAMMESIQQVTKGMATKEELQAAVDQAKPVPPGNFDAEEIQDVYKPEEMIGADLLKSIPVKDWQDSIKKSVNINMPYRFISSRMKDIANGPNSVQRLRVLRYLNFLVIFLKSAKKGKERGTLSIPRPDKLAELMAPAPKSVIENIRRRFTEGGIMRKFHIDLLMTWCCALGAVLENYEFETSGLRYDLSLDERDFAKYFKEIGGRVSSVVGEKKGTRVQRAKLALPLEFPKVRIMRR